MNGKLSYNICLALGALSLILLVVNVALIDSNRHLQDSANQRQAEINKASSLANLNQGLVQALASAAVDSNDVAAKDLLASQGIKVKTKGGEAAPAAAPNIKK